MISSADRGRRAVGLVGVVDEAVGSARDHEARRRAGLARRYARIWDTTRAARLDLTSRVVLDTQQRSVHYVAPFSLVGDNGT